LTPYFLRSCFFLSTWQLKISLNQLEAIYRAHELEADVVGLLGGFNFDYKINKKCLRKMLHM